MSDDDSPKHTERSVLDLLRERHAKQSGNGPEWAYMEHVRDAAGFSARRTADALALHLWPSRGHELHGYEVKVSRSDWRRELADPAKAEAWCRIVDRWWIVAPRGIVPPEELPTGWGLLEAAQRSGKGVLVQRVPALTLRPPDERAPIDRGLLACLLRSAGAALEFTPNEAALREAERRGVEKGADAARRGGEVLVEDARRQRARADEAAARLREVEDLLRGDGGPLWSSRLDRLARVGEGLRAVLDGDEAVRGAQARARRVLRELEWTVDKLREVAGNEEPGT